MIILAARAASGENPGLLGAKNLRSTSSRNNNMNMKILLLSFILVFICGCSPNVTVAPMDRAYLNDYLMKPDRDSLAIKMFDHAYYSREGSRGGRGIGGGGCGCN